mmetsp:Transcript_15776/g.35502  ORF Transcript_15776/g.35502 Transcript_15776/m.35502 type:complete len:205 (+) Transcript_15776:1078-1692(+)
MVCPWHWNGDYRHCYPHTMTRNAPAVLVDGRKLDMRLHRLMPNLLEDTVLANYVPSTQVFSFQLHHHSHHTACLVPTPTYFPFSICPSTICCRKMMTTSALRRNCAENANVSNIALESHTFAGASVPPWSDYPKGATLTQMQLIPPPPQSHPSRDSSSHYAETFTFKMVSLAVSAWSMINPPYMHPMLPNRRPLLLIPTLPVLS